MGSKKPERPPVSRAMDTPKELTRPEFARALHRVVRAMHDGHCPKCGHLGSSNDFANLKGHTCPVCQFHISAEEAKEALEIFSPYLKESVGIFEKWATFRTIPLKPTSPPPPIKR